MRLQVRSTFPRVNDNYGISSQDNTGLSLGPHRCGRSAAYSFSSEVLPSGHRANHRNKSVGIPLASNGYGRIRASLRPLVVGEHLGQADLGIGVSLLRPLHMCISLQGDLGSRDVRLFWPSGRVP